MARFRGLPVRGGDILTVVGASSDDGEMAQEAEMAEIKTRPTDVSVDAFLEGVAHPVRRADGGVVRAMMERVTGEPATIWGLSIIGFGRYHYRYASGHEGEMCRVGFSPRAANLALADQLVAETSAPVVFVASSGFLAGPVGSADHSASRRLVQSGFAITLLPSLDIDTATDIVVARQLGRGFGFERETEERKFRERFCIYRSEGAMLVVSVAPPEVVAEVVLTRLSLG